FTPTIAHVHISKMVEDLLHKCFPQTIDMLEHTNGNLRERRVEARGNSWKLLKTHASFMGQSCRGCNTAYQAGQMKECILARTVP
ncbi:hypothetical protein HOY82DRAFT_469512, partial [Tuber indicum]